VGVPLHGSYGRTGGAAAARKKVGNRRESRYSRRRESEKMRSHSYLIAAAMIFGAPAAYSQARSEYANEPRWRASIEADIRNGAPANYICINAKSSAVASEDASFKDWAYGVARKHCPPGEIGAFQAPPPQPSQKGPSPVVSRCRFPTDHDIKRAAKGIRVDLSAENCVFIANPNKQDGYKYMYGW
jgi:hypothetical protein